MLNGWHLRWVCWPCKNLDVFSFQELCTDPCKHGAVHYHANMKCHTCCLPSALCVKTVIHSVKRTLLQSARRQRMWAFAHSSQLQWQTAVRSRPRWGRWACRWASLRRFLTVCAEILGYCKPIVAAACPGGCLGAGCGGPGLVWLHVVCGLWCRLDVLPNSLKRLWRWLMLENEDINSRATALVGHSAVNHANCTLPQTCDICCIMLCDKTAHFRVAFS